MIDVVIEVMVVVVLLIILLLIIMFLVYYNMFFLVFYSVCFIFVLLYGVDKKEIINVVVYEYDWVIVYMIFEFGMDVLKDVWCVDV